MNRTPSYIYSPLNPYRFGFNGKEKDSEGTGGGCSTYDYGFRIYNPQIGRFLSIDPLAKKYPELTPYQFASNRPIDGIDLDGLEWVTKDYGLTSEDFASDLVKPQIKVAQTAYNAQVLTNKVNSSITFGLKLYSGITEVPVMYGGSVENVRGENSRGIIYLYDLSLEYEDKAISTFLHEYDSHYMEDILDLIPNTPNNMRVEYEPNPFLGQENDPYKGQKTIPVTSILSPCSTIKEEINGYSLEKQLNDNGYTKLKENDIKDINNNLINYEEVLKNTCPDE